MTGFMDSVLPSVKRHTVITDGFRRHAAPESIRAHLHEWQEANARLARQIRALEDLLAERETEIERGEWPRHRDADDG